MSVRQPQPRFQEGQSISAAAMNRLAASVEDAHRQVARLELLIASRKGFEIKQVRDATVCVVETPTAASATLRVRRVRYRTNPPTPCVEANNELTCNIEWVGDTFDAWPDFGKTFLDYEGFVVAGPLDPEGGYAFDESSVFLPARFVEQQWIVEPRPVAGTGFFYAVVLDSIPTNTPSALFLRVHRVKPAEPPAIGWIVDPEADPEDVQVFPNHEARHYLPMTRAAKPNVIRVWMVDGSVHAEQVLRVYLANPSSTYPSAQCPTGVL